MNKKQTIQLSRQNIAYTFKRSTRARLMRLEISGAGGLVVTAPNRLPMFRVEKFIRSKAGWVLDKLAILNTPRPVTRFGGGRREYLKHKEAARALVLERLEFFSRKYHLAHEQVKIKNHRSRWGSCSRKGNLNFNYQIIKLPSRLADYVIAHELCHLREFNHGRAFWQLLGRAIPDWRDRRSELKNYSSR